LRTAIDNPYLNGLIKVFQPKILFSIFGNGSFFPMVHTVRKYTPSPVYSKIIEGALGVLFKWRCDKFGPQDQRLPLYHHLFEDASMTNIVVFF
jgi:hypothetical protein